MPATAPAQKQTSGPQPSEKEAAQDRQLKGMVMKHQGTHLRQILDDERAAEVLSFEIDKAIANVRKWFPPKPK